MLNFDEIKESLSTLLKQADKATVQAVVQAADQLTPMIEEKREGFELDDYEQAALTVDIVSELYETETLIKTLFDEPLHTCLRRFVDAVRAPIFMQPVVREKIGDGVHPATLLPEIKEAAPDDFLQMIENAEQLLDDAETRLSDIAIAASEKLDSMERHVDKLQAEGMTDLNELGENALEGVVQMYALNAATSLAREEVAYALGYLDRFFNQ